MSTSSPPASNVVRGARQGDDVRLLAGISPEERTRQDAEETRRERELQARYQEGLAAGADAARAELAEEVRRAVTWLEEQGDCVRRAHQDYLRGAEGEVLRLVCDLVAKILARETDTNPEAAEPILRQALHALSDREEIAIRVSPEHLEAFRRMTDAMGGLVSSPAGVRWVPDRRVPRSGIVVETEAGKLDARIDTQLEEAAKLFHEVLHGRAA